MGKKVSKHDSELAEAAKGLAGGPAALAKIFGVTVPAASEWGRTRPIPRHVRPRLEEYTKSRQHRPDDEAAQHRKELSGSVQDLLRVLEPDPASSRVARLPSRYRRRYEERVEEVIARVKRELEEYQAVLEAEHRSPRSLQKGNRKGAGP